MTEPTASPASRRAPIIILIVAVVILLAQIAREERIISRLKMDQESVQAEVEKRAAATAAERLQGHREDIVRAAQTLQDFYHSDDGLRRPDGLWNAAAHQVDMEAIGVWLFDVYLKARINGASDEDARKQMTDAIRGTDEWRRVHGK